MLPASGGNIVAMSGGGVAKQHPNGGGGPPVSDQRSETGLPLNPLSSKDVTQQGSGAGLVFANGGSRKRKLRQSQSGGVPAHLVPQQKQSPPNASPPPTVPVPDPAASTTTTVSVTTSSAPTPTPTPTPVPVPTPAPPSDPNNIDDILTKLIGSLPKTKDTYTNEEQDSLLKNLTRLLNSDTNKKFTIEIK
jgi:hypothetical protein